MESQMGTSVRLVLVCFVLVGTTCWPARMALAAPTPPPSAPAPSSPDVDADARAVYCLQDDNRPDLVETAEGLGLAKAGSSGRLIPAGQTKAMDVAEWRQREGPAFERACASLVKMRKLPKAAEKGSGIASGLAAWLNTVSSVFLGALATLMASAVTGRRASYRDRANELRGAVGAYRNAVLVTLEAQAGKAGAHEEKKEMVPPVLALTGILLREQRRKPLREKLNKLRERVDELDLRVRTQSSSADGVARDELERIVKDLNDAADRMEQAFPSFRTGRG